MFSHCACAVILVLFFWATPICGQSFDTPDFRQLLQKLTAFSPDPCDASPGERDEDLRRIEMDLFDQAAALVIQSLNADGASQRSGRERAAQALKSLEQVCAEVNKNWPDDNRFHAQVHDISPALVIKMGVRMVETFFVFGMSERQWQQVGQDHSLYDRELLFYHRATIYRLTPGRSGHPRFLAKFDDSGCAGSVGVGYEANEWYPEIGEYGTIFQQTGAWGLDDKGPGVTLPYCWFSPIDTGDNPSLCAVGRSPRFVGRVYNRPDLVPVAKAMEYAQKRDYPAVLGYCVSSPVARRLVRDLPPHVFADMIRVRRTGNGRERVEIGFDHTLRFDVEKRAGRWQIAALHVD
jgi:hypothetical protein